MVNLLGNGFDVTENEVTGEVGEALLAYTRRMADGWISHDETRWCVKPSHSRALLERVGDEVEAICLSADDSRREALLGWLDERRYHADMLRKEWRRTGSVHHAQMSPLRVRP